MTRRTRQRLLSSLVLALGLGWLILAWLDGHRRPFYVVMGALFLISGVAGLVSSWSARFGPD